MHGEQPQRAAVRQPIMDEVETPAFVRLPGRARRLGAADQPLLAATTLAHLQALGSIEPIDPLVIVPEPFPPQQHEQSAIAPAPPHRGVAPQGRAHRRFIAAAVGLVVIAAHGQVQQPARPRSAHRIILTEIIHGGTTGGGLYQFFEFTSLSIRMSSAWSATIFFSSLFSRSSCRRRWSWLGSSPP